MDALDLVYALAGVAVGAVAMAAIVEAKARGAGAGPVAKTKLTTGWRIAELDKPLVVARDVEAEVPAGARVLASGEVAASAYAAATVRQVAHTPAEFAVDDAGTKALLFLGGVRPDATALVTVDPELVGRLVQQAKSLWDQSEPYVERRGLAEVASRAGLLVETQGTVQDVLPYQGAYLLRLEDAGQILGVRVDKEPSELRGQRVLVRGRMAKDATGYPLLHANDLRRIH